jgi:hypothetical protein
MRKECTIQEAIKEVNKKRNLKHIGFRVRTTPHLPTGDDKYFPGMSSVKVSKVVFIDTIKDCLEHFEPRGAKIELTIPTVDFESFYIG